jgi:hypothetical protein
MSVFLEMLVDSQQQMNPNHATAEPIIFDDSAFMDFQLNQLLRDPDTSNSTSPTSLAPLFEQGFDWMKTPYDWSVASIPHPESEPSVLQSSGSPGSEELRKKRREQNRKSQKAFRERQEARFRHLQAAYDALLAQHHDLINSLEQLSQERKQFLSTSLQQANRHSHWIAVGHP